MKPKNSVAVPAKRLQPIADAHARRRVEVEGEDAVEAAARVVDVADVEAVRRDPRDDHVEVEVLAMRRPAACRESRCRGGSAPSGTASCRSPSTLPGSRVEALQAAGMRRCAGGR